MLENHGVVVAGDDLGDAFRRFETLEFTAQALVHANQLGSVKYLDTARLDKVQDSQHEALEEYDPFRPTSVGKEARKDIVDFVHRAYAHRLMNSGWGSFSARVDEDAFIITPQHVDRRELDLADLVVIRDGRRAAGQFPSGWHVCIAPSIKHTRR